MMFMDRNRFYEETILAIEELYNAYKLDEEDYDEAYEVMGSFEEGELTEEEAVEQLRAYLPRSVLALA